MATEIIPTHPFTRWSRSIDGPELVLIRDAEGRVAEWVELDVRELPNRCDLQGRLGPQARSRLLADARNFNGG